MKLKTLLKRCAAAARLHEVERIDSGRERFEWQFSPLEPRHMFDGDGVIADPGASPGDVPALFADMTRPADAGNSPPPQINNLDTGLVASDGDETLAQTFHAV